MHILSGASSFVPVFFLCLMHEEDGSLIQDDTVKNSVQSAPECAPATPAIKRAASTVSTDNDGGMDSYTHPIKRSRSTVSGHDVPCPPAVSDEKNACNRPDEDELYPTCIENLFNTDDSWYSMTLQEQEWNGLVSGCRTILKSFRTRDGKLVAIVRRPQGYVIVGIIVVSEMYTTDNVRKLSQTSCNSMYPTSYINSFIRKANNPVAWTLSDVIVFPSEAPLYFAGPKFRNRTTLIRQDMLRAKMVTQPKEQTLRESARYFLELMPDDLKTSLGNAMRIANGKTIRIGTSCSGIDVCITVFRETISFLNQMFGTDVKVSHVFSCELNQTKRNLIMKQHPDMLHCFADVAVFRDGVGHCYVCKKDHATDKSVLNIDIHMSGPSCKDVSTLNTNRADSANCYADPSVTGTSGSTYQLGVKTVSLQHLECCIYIYVYIYVCFAYFVFQICLHYKEIYIYIFSVMIFFLFTVNLCLKLHA